jgi:hypothetical protein
VAGPEGGDEVVLRREAEKEILAAANTLILKDRPETLFGLARMGKLKRGLESGGKGGA